MLSSNQTHTLADNCKGSHPLLAQIPLTVSPYISLPTAPTLPYTYKPLPSTLPPSSTTDAQGAEREKYVVAPSGHTAHPDEILASCKALQAHIYKVQDNAEKTLKKWVEDLDAQDLAEKRKVAPGWLDREEKILEPQKMNVGDVWTGAEPSVQARSASDQQNPSFPHTTDDLNLPDPAGDELDRAFGGMDVTRSS